MNIQEKLYNKAESLAPLHLNIINESADHSGNRTESHFKVIVVSDFFTDLRLIERHRYVQKLYKEEIAVIHAFTLHAYTPDEWDLRDNAPTSPKCGGN